MGDEFTPIQNVDEGYLKGYLSGRAAAVDDIEALTHQDIIAAAEAVVRAAAEARTREFLPEGSAYYDEDGNEHQSLHHVATDHFYVPLAGGTRYQNTTTGAIVDDPREPDESRYRWIVDQFTYFHERWPSTVRTLAEHCEDARAAIMSGEMTPYQGVGHTVSNDWAGTARDDFLRYFLNPFGNAVSNQQLLLTELSAAMYGYEALLKQARVDARNLADKTVEALDDIDAHSGGSVSTLLGVIGVTLAVITPLMTAGTTTALTLGLLGAGVRGAQLVADQEKEISGDTVDDVLRQLSDRLSDLREAMDAEENAIADALEETASSVETLLGSRDPLVTATILPNEPNDDDITNVTGGGVPRPDEFRPPE